MIIRLRSLISVTLAMGALQGVLVGATPPEQIDFFEKQVRPLLVEHCYECHSAEKKIKGGLALDTRESTLKGGDTGPALVAGDPEKSLLINAVRYGNHDLQMPPKRRLADTEVKTLEAWVKMGAPDPREAVVAKQGRVIDINEGRKFWSFRPLTRVEPPAVPPAASPIDAFLQAKLAEKGLVPAPPADKRTLLRRATFDLIGLPPTPEEMDAFVADNACSPRRIMANGGGGTGSMSRAMRTRMAWTRTSAFGNAWRYRDYVVRAFNDDKPYDQFLIEQIAGDLLPPSEDSLAATRLSLARRAGAGGARYAEAGDGHHRRADRHRRQGVPRHDAGLRALPRS